MPRPPQTPPDLEQVEKYVEIGPTGASTPILYGRSMSKVSMLFGQNDSFVAGLYGINTNMLYKMTEGGASKFSKRSRRKKTKSDSSPTESLGNKPLIPRYAIYTRFLLSNPECVEKTIGTFYELLEELQKLDPSITDRHLCIMLGLEMSAVKRLEKDELALSSAPRSFINLLIVGLRLAKNTEEKNKILNSLIENVNDEAMAREIDLETIWLKGGWTKNSPIPEIINARQKPTKKKQEEE